MEIWRDGSNLRYNFGRRSMQKTISTRIPIELEEEIARFMKEEELDKSSAIRRILEIGVEKWKRRRAAELYKPLKLEDYPREMLDEMNRLSVPIHVTLEDLE